MVLYFPWEPLHNKKNIFCEQKIQYKLFYLGRENKVLLSFTVFTVGTFQHDSAILSSTQDRIPECQTWNRVTRVIRWILLKFDNMIGKLRKKPCLNLQIILF